MSKSAIKLAAKRPSHVVCVERGEYRIDLVVGKVYRTVKAESNDPATRIRIIDESGEDYLYPVDWFVAVDLSVKAKRALAAAS